jgi:hypothetical protein
MLTRLSIEVDKTELDEFRKVLEKLTENKPVVEVKLNSTIRSVSRMILKDIEKWEDFKKDR